MTQALLILWDIDHTLISTGGVGREVFGEAFKAATGHQMDAMAEATGRTEPDLFRETLERHGVTERAEHFTIFAEAQAEGYAIRADELRSKGQVLPGVNAALDQLAQSNEVTQSVLTGNTRAAAKIKLEILEIAHNLELDIGSYGDDAPSRPILVRIAQERAEQKHGIHYDSANTVLIGDTVRDIQAGHEGGAKVIAVASGQATVWELRDSDPHAVLPDLSDSQTLMRTIEPIRISR